MLLVACVQFGFHARSHLYSAADVRDWRPDFIERIVVLAIGVAMVMAPPAGSSESAWRWAATGIALAAATGEAVWIFFTTSWGRRANRTARDWFRPTRHAETGEREVTDA